MDVIKTSGYCPNVKPSIVFDVINLMIKFMPRDGAIFHVFLETGACLHGRIFMGNFIARKESVLQRILGNLRGFVPLSECVSRIIHGPYLGTWLWCWLLGSIWQKQTCFEVRPHYELCGVLSTQPACRGLELVFHDSLIPSLPHRHWCWWYIFL